jgi:hypothetical protein
LLFKAVFAALDFPMRNKSKIKTAPRFASARFAFAVAGFGFDIFDFPLARTEGFRGIFDFQNSTYIKQAARCSRWRGRRALCGNR